MLAAYGLVMMVAAFRFVASDPPSKEASEKFRHGPLKLGFQGSEFAIAGTGKKGQSKEVLLFQDGILLREVRYPLVTKQPLMTRKLSDGKEVLIVVTKGDDLVTCDLQDDPEDIEHFLSTVAGKPIASVVGLTGGIRIINGSALHQHLLSSKILADATFRLGRSQNPQVNVLAYFHQMRKDCKEAQAELGRISHPEQRTRRAAFWKRMFIFPGTKWCGRSNIASSYEDLGEDRNTDMCCRTHDHCNTTIGAFQTKYYLHNRIFYTISQCGCDHRLLSCLKAVVVNGTDEIASEVGELYFNVLGTPCFDLKMQSVCTEYKGHWWRRTCAKHETKLAAVTRSQYHF